MKESKVFIYAECPYCGNRNKLSDTQVEDLLKTDKCVIECEKSDCHKLHTVMIEDETIFVKTPTNIYNYFDERNDRYV